MFGPDLYFLLSDILIGSTTLLTLCAIAWLVVAARDQPFLPWLSSQFKRLFQRYTPHGNAGNQAREYFLFPVLAATVLGLGLAIQSIVDDIVDHSPLMYDSVAWLGQLTLKTEEAYRFSAIFKRAASEIVAGQPVTTDPQPRVAGIPVPPPVWAASETCDPSKKYDLSPLGAELLLPQKEIVAHVLDPSQELHRTFYRDTELFLHTPAQDRCDLATTIASKIYYDATNWATGQESLNDVLRRWETQVDFLGSLSLSAGVILVLSVATMLAWGLLNLAASVRLGRPYADWWERRTWLPRWSKTHGPYGKFGSAVRLTLMAGVLWWAGGYGFVVAQRNFIERALGAYASAHHFERIVKHPLGCMRIEEIIEQENRACQAPAGCVADLKLTIPRTCERELQN
jgi:hypothetical protein